MKLRRPQLKTEAHVRGYACPAHVGMLLWTRAGPPSTWRPGGGRGHPVLSRQHLTFPRAGQGDTYPALKLVFLQDPGESLFLGQEFCALRLQLKARCKQESEGQDLRPGRGWAATPSYCRRTLSICRRSHLSFVFLPALVSKVSGQKDVSNFRKVVMLPPGPWAAFLPRPPGRPLARTLHQPPFPSSPQGDRKDQVSKCSSPQHWGLCRSC